MFEKFDDDARRALVITKEANSAVGKDHLCTEHLLFAIRPGSGGADLENPSGHHGSWAQPGGFPRSHSPIASWPRPSYVSRYIPFSTDTKEALESALHTSELLGHNHTGPKHLLAGLARTTNSNAGKLLAGLGITEDRVFVAIDVARRGSTIEPSTTPARTFAIFVPVGKLIFKNGGRVYPDLATARAAHPEQEFAPFPLPLTDGEFFDVGAALPENRFKSRGSYASYPDAFTSAEQFRKNLSGYEIAIRIMTPVTTEHRGTDAGGRDVILSRTVSYDRVRVTSWVMELASANTEGASLV